MNSNLANPWLILKDKSQQAWSGCIEVAEPKDSSVNWQIYLSQGKVQYITSTAGQQERFNYLWKWLKLGSDCPQVSTENDYEQLCKWISQRQLTDLNARKLLLKLNQEALNQILSIETTSIKFVDKFVDDRVLPKTIADFVLAELILKEIINNWQQVRGYLNSSFSRLGLETDKNFQFYKIWKQLCNDSEFSKFANTQKIGFLIDKLAKKAVFYQLAAQINLNCFSLARYLKYLIELDAIDILPFTPFTEAKSTILPKSSLPTKVVVPKIERQKYIQKPSPSNSEAIDNQPVIACIDDSNTVQKQVKMTLEAVGYQVISITNPAVALKGLSRQNPVLILMDINMPNISGYDLCSMLRRANKFQETPIVMLTGRDGIIDRVRAKFVGATDYLTKPFQPNTLIEIVQKLALATTSG